MSETRTAPVRPRTINVAIVLMLLSIAFGVIGWIAWYGHDSLYVNLFIDSNKKLSKPVSPYGTAQALADLHRQQKGVLISTAVISVVLLLLAYALTRPRAATAGRWGLVIFLVVTGSASLPYHGVPVLLNIGKVGQGLCMLAAAVLMFVPASSRYFRECKGQAAAQMGDRPTLSSLFTGSAAARQRLREQRAGSGSGSASEADAGAESAKDVSENVMNKQRAKARTDQAAVAKGADLARQRAKASKSRRTDLGG